MKSISFLPKFIPLIKYGRKVVTRRINTKLKPGDYVYFKTGRTGKKEGYIQIKEITKERLQEIHYRNDEWEMRTELKDEGFDILKGLLNQFQEFEEIWNKLNNKKGFRWKDNPEVFKIRFEYICEPGKENGKK